MPSASLESTSNFKEPSGKEAALSTWDSRIRTALIPSGPLFMWLLLLQSPGILSFPQLLSKRRPLRRLGDLLRLEMSGQKSVLLVKKKKKKNHGGKIFHHKRGAFTLQVIPSQESPLWGNPQTHVHTGVQGTSGESERTWAKLTAPPPRFLSPLTFSQQPPVHNCVSTPHKIL